MTNKDIELIPEKGKIDIQRLKREYYYIINDITHTPPCFCRSCVYQLYKKRHKGKGNKFDAESFFLDDVAFEARRSKMLRIPTYEDLGPGKGYGNLVYKIEFREYIRTPIPINDLCNLIKKEFPNINSNPKRIKSKIWRLRKSKIVNDLESEIQEELIRTQPEPSLEKKKEWERYWKELKFAQRLADFIYLQSNKRVKQRDLLRRFNIHLDDLKAIKGKLVNNYGIQIMDNKGYRKKTTYYYGSRKSSKGIYWGMEL